jgi:hypothetical protein
VRPPVTPLDGPGEFFKDDCDPEFDRLVEGEFVMAASDVLNEGMPARKPRFTTTGNCGGCKVWSAFVP